MKPPLIWVDLETTGLNPNGRILEIAMAITYEDEEPLWIANDVIQATTDVHYWLEDGAKTMHEESGLLSEVYKDSAIALDVLETHLLKDLAERDLEPFTCPLAGSSVHFDRAFLRTQMPNLEAWFHYRNVDVSTIKELVARWYPDVAENTPEPAKAHRAASDLVDSMRELQYYREHAFRL